ncbi:MAG: ATP-binding protein [Acinetobacter sp.]|uniref:ATP-binding protein n=1 Tax=Acinetobacter sp. TaxID=472 RepID=UPI0026DFA038|nr:ATP-binding protein [Acinetobacter sp.]MDO5541748.1 ATP-binding protein [Acinetobacter sp.]
MTAYVLKYSHNIIEHLGLKLYQNKPTNVIAELVSNSWDAEAENSWVDLVTHDGSPIAILTSDDGLSMSDQEIIDNWLIIAKKKNVVRNDSHAKRKPMGRKGIGKLAPFGIGKKVDLICFKDNKINWLSLNYKDMMSESVNELISTYSPQVIARNLDNFCHADIVAYINTLPKSLQTTLNQRIQSIKNSKHGTIIVCHDLSLKRVIETQTLKKSLGRRFTVTLNTPFFNVLVNEEPLTDQECLPEFILRIPETGLLEDLVEIPQFDEFGNPKMNQDGTPLTISQPIKYWVGFVSSSEQTQDQSGIGVFAHGKMAQDRPFTFDSKGLEIKTRYMYGVIEADWVDEYEDDIISTDRTSIDWGYLGLPAFFDWGKAFVRKQIAIYDKFKKENLEKDIDTKIEKKLADKTIITTSEKKHLRTLLLDVLPEQDLSDEQETKLIEATAKAWTHEPARKLIKSLWEQTSKFENNNFPDLINQLVDELVPESLSLAVVFSQRVYALTQLFRRITLGKETQLQKLIEEFPWILGNNYDHFIPNRTLKTICKEAEDSGVIINNHLIHTISYDNNRPDFVFFSTTSDKEILIVELKGPELTSGEEELQQLQSYILFLKRRFAGAAVRGILVSSHFDEVICGEAKPSGITYISWNDILLQSRLNHMELLSALLAGSDTNPQDARVQQICELGGSEVMDFLTRMSSNNDDLKSIVQKLSKSDV